MLKIILLTSLILLTPPLLAQGSQNSDASDSTKQIDKVVVRVNDDVITEQQVAVLQATLSEQLSGQRISQELVVNELIKISVLHQEAKKQSFHLRPEIIDAIEQYSKSLLSTLLIQELSQSMIPTEEELRGVYQQQLLLIPSEEYRVSYLVTKDKATAEDVIKRLDKRENFGDLAVEFSIDPSKSVGGDLDWTNALQLDKKLMAAIEALETGQHFKTPLQNKQGWQVAQLREKRKTRKPQYGQVKQGLTEELLAKKLDSYITELMEKSVITYSEE